MDKAKSAHEIRNLHLQLQSRAARQQPGWSDPPQVRRMRDLLASRPMLVRARDVLRLRSLLAEVAEGGALVVQAGDCAEDPDECLPEALQRKIAALHTLGNALTVITGKPVLRAGRIGGQFAKPRSSPTEQVGDRTLPAFRGHLVNDPAPTPECREPDPLRLLTGYMAASEIMEYLGWRGERSLPQSDPPIWTSHEALLLDYEVPLVRQDETAALILGSTHWPWVGERTRQVDGAHVALLGEVANPVACKVGPRTTKDELLALCERLDPDREPGRLTLISRMGADFTAYRLMPLVESVAAAGHPVIWLCDPMHANTVATPEGQKTRLVKTLMREVTDFVPAVQVAGGVAGGLHLETTPDDVTECVIDESGFAQVGARYRTFCDPRLTLWQAVAVISAWGNRHSPIEQEGARDARHTPY
ncbi:3-deoxy-7-phosphoheptulonate synthase [Actinomadura sp. 7K507]|uniref:3-deoxy-7-phosphoheptulonate synthase n=1 Tax=Actinomadura sp. 7K507 TaxID=2530365 RepID=UPI001044A83D|nr:3-deoxy-7-phosphoheptulonate synthase [Actinomadura sp. 7K507]TDC98385.1 phospho-2-dehydro-3-deoxyheptonate aldolase [Actinomadura sp. 7K507]